APLGTIEPRSIRGLRFAVATNYLLDDLDDAVGAAFERALTILSAAGASIERIRIDELERLPGINAKGGFPAPEVYRWHRALIERARDRYDPRVLVRILRGADQTAVDYLDLIDARRALIAAIDPQTVGYDALLAPTTAIVAPPIAELEASDKAYGRANALMLRNPSTFNFLDRCALSLPIPVDGAPVGLLVVGERMADARLLAVGLAVEAALAA
ncbi:MAG: amidase family protein, partial [Vulcanimicrobiaceae bacterium]